MPVPIRSTRLVMTLLAPAAAAGAVYAADLQQQVPVYELVEDLRIKSDDSHPDRTFTSILGFSVTSGGDIAVSHPQEGLVRLFNARGEFLRTLGRRGNGPGEFNGSTLWVHSLDDLIVMDGSVVNQGDRYALYSRDGRLVREINAGRLPPLNERRNLTRVLALLPGGRRFVRRQYFETVAARGETIEYDSTVFSIEDTTGRTLHRVLLAPPVPRLSSMRVEMSPNAFTAIGQRLDPRIAAAVSPGGGHMAITMDAELWRGKPGYVRVVTASPTGTVATSDVALPALRVPRNFADSVAKVSREQALQVIPRPAGVPPRPRPTPAALDRLEREVRENTYVPEYYPATGTVLLGRDNTLWISSRADPRNWTVVSGARAQMQLRSPEDVDIRVVSRDKVWGLRRDADGVPMIVRFNVVPARQR